ncbi:MAG: 30S ribosomal protein THX [Bacteroidales bacterium]|nr:30S ribosomal protein THX [Bacteroidales bacterium]MBN2764355.1 30S ribosomal protein THX [Bacteroidales bacterium]
MGKGDKKTRRGKITIKSYGVSRPRFKKKNTAAAPVIEKPTVKAPEKEIKKPVAKKTTAKPKKKTKATETAKKKK